MITNEQQHYIQTMDIYFKYKAVYTEMVVMNWKKKYKKTNKTKRTKMNKWMNKK